MPSLGFGQLPIFFFLVAVYREHSVHMPQVRTKLMGDQPARNFYM